MATGRGLDVVLFGATGFTGELTAEYLARHAPAGLRWGLAGRSLDRLVAVRGRLAAMIDPALAELELLVADVGDRDAVRAVAEAASVVITTVGPYITYGDALVAACAEAGTDYVDLTGEPEFVDQVYLRHHAKAVATGARLVHCCGFDSIPHDLGVYFTVKQLPEGVPIAVEGFVRASGTFSGGTFHSAITAFSRLRQGARTAAQRRKVEGRGVRRVRGTAGKPKHVKDIGWALPMPSIDPQVVLRSARALERYGSEFSYGHYVAVKRLPVAVGLVGGVAGLVALAQLPPARNWLLGRKKAGDGPTARQRDKAWFKVVFHAEGGGHRVVTEVSGGDPGYGETSKMLAEAAMCLAVDELPPTSGQVTTAVAMGDALLDRLIAAGIRFRRLD
ncbi:saccharopine dehydrogenase NADP-binding domain-containing protein [Actinokineospora sp. NBRC 105648]|uniref:saccharopine dehydrogenase family protein n=1 Tax=Actinokineospora sp. NBRC 105648 TaxID=3032206 RepID=UPI0024A5AEED|nr:saccharopine dehydrogenase NADP-binding domain-containing protein [Actinokineospora sp. NBRC 105648]GLZ42481.1 saccharopine dehydrogenase [Actinokineospora sp. NBRC 105648]